DTILHERGRHAVHDTIFPLANADFEVFRPVFLHPWVWQSLTQIVWGRTVLERETWQLEYEFWHQAHQQIDQNFVEGQFFQSFTEAVQLECSCIAVSESDAYFAAGFVDGTVRVYDIGTMALLTVLGTSHGGPILVPVRGIVISGEDSFTFATEDGNIYCAPIIGPSYRAVVSRRLRGDLLSFAGNRQWWVGLFVTFPAFDVWDLRQGEPQLVYSGGEFRRGRSVHVSVTSTGLRCGM
ncbi:hypothetical protein PIB30_106514, partial [Stylosanthes scabra]|nr:hypothetical protein [Stylosanthes scabra]